MTNRLPPISALKAFEATVRHESVTRAAKALNLTDGAISRAVRELEAHIGVDLFQRGNRLIRPTIVARALADDVRDALDNLTGALERARRASASERPLVLSCEPTFLIRWLIPRLSDLQAAVGIERELRLVSAGGAVRFARDGVDLAIRRADFTLSDDVLAEVFLKERIGPVCRPELALRGPVDATLLHTASRPDAWSRWSALTGIGLRPSREVRFEHFYQSLQAAGAGAGLAIGPIALVADDLGAGSLIAPWGLQSDGTAYVLMGPRASVDKAVFDLVRDWLVEATKDLAMAVLG